MAVHDAASHGRSRWRRTNRPGTVEEVAWWAAALCSRYADWLTGEVLTIDGGHWLEREGYMSALGAES